MNIHVASPPDAAPKTGKSSRLGLAIADGDIHPRPKSAKSLDPYLSQRWREHMATYGMTPRHGYQAGPLYPKGNPDASRRDAYTPDGGPAGLGSRLYARAIARPLQCRTRHSERDHAGTGQRAESRVVDRAFHRAE